MVLVGFHGGAATSASLDDGPIHASFSGGTCATRAGQLHVLRYVGGSSEVA